METGETLKQHEENHREVLQAIAELSNKIDVVQAELSKKIDVVQNELSVFKTETNAQNEAIREGVACNGVRIFREK